MTTTENDSHKSQVSKKGLGGKQARLNKKNQEPSTMRWLAETAVMVGIAFLLATGIKTFLIQPYIVPSGSMLPTIQLKDRILANKLVFRGFDNPKYKDIIVFEDPTDEFPMLVKRVIAVGGQTIDLRNGSVYVDDKLLDEPYVYGQLTMPQILQMPIAIPEGYVWVMGDNRGNSGDSRSFGPVPVKMIKGRVFSVYWPLNRIGKME